MSHAVQHLGAYATSAAGGSQGISWRGCVFQDVSAGSHMLGDVTDAVLNETDPTKWDREMLVEDCKILNIPVEYTGATGLFAGYVQSLTVQHNHFANQVGSELVTVRARQARSFARMNEHLTSYV